MSGYILDTNVVSLLSPSKEETSQVFLTWLEDADASGGIFLTAVTLHEIERGITLLASKGASAKAKALRRWIDGIVSTYEDRIIPIDAAVASLSGQLEAISVSAGHNPGMADALIAGAAKFHSMTVVTFNERHFEPFGVKVMTPPL